MWHVKGGNGVGLTKKDEQPDAADPVFSKDGRFIYFSARDSRYRYDRNVNEGIWQIKRLDRWNGQTVPITSALGGAAAPVLSPDGKTLAYVGRLRAKTVLTLFDLASGKTRQIASDLQRDNQEGFSFHGVFPGYAFTPDGKAIVATAGGKIWKLGLDDAGARAAIPFTAKIEQTLTESLHTPRRRGVDDVRARIVRWPVESPDGKTLVFSALGHLYAMPLPAGTPARVTSRHGSRVRPVVLAGRPDAHLRQLERRRTRETSGSCRFPGGTPRKLTTVSGQYVNPSFSPDGSSVVFVSGGGAAFNEEDLSDELWEEIRVVPSAGGAASYVIGTKNRGPNRRMARPQFDADGRAHLFRRGRRRSRRQSRRRRSSSR